MISANNQYIPRIKQEHSKNGECMKRQMLVLTATLVLGVGCQKSQTGTSQGNDLDIVTSSIVNGKVLEEEKRAEEPWDQVVGLVDANGQIGCSATIIDETTLYTAAHCFFTSQDAANMAFVIQESFQTLAGAKVALEQARAELAGEEFTEEKAQELAEISDETKAGMVDNYLKKYTEKLAAHMGMYQGEGVVGGALKEDQYQKNFASIEMDPAFLEQVRQQIFAYLRIKPDRPPVSQNYFLVQDFAKVTLSKPLEGVTKFEVLPADEVGEMMMDENIRMVGYGFRADPEQEMRKEVMEKVQKGEKLEQPVPKQFKGSSFEAEVQKVLTERFAVTNDAGFPDFPERWENAPEYEVNKMVGEKRYVDTVIQGTSGLYMLSGVKGETNGACSGDSGGGVFYKNKDGKWRYAGVINLKSAAGCGSSFFDVTKTIQVYNANTATLLVSQQPEQPEMPPGLMEFFQSLGGQAAKLK